MPPVRRRSGASPSSRPSSAGEAADRWATNRVDFTISDQADKILDALAAEDALGRTRAFRRLVFGADLHSPTEVFELGVGDALSAEPLEDARRFLAKACGQHAATFRLVKASHRREAWERIAARPPAEREALIDALLSAKHAVSASLAG